MKAKSIIRIHEELQTLPKHLLPPEGPIATDMAINAYMNEILNGKTVEVFELGVRSPIHMVIRNVVVDPIWAPKRIIHLHSDHGTEERVPEDKIWKFLMGSQVNLRDSTGEEYAVFLRDRLPTHKFKKAIKMIDPRNY